MKYLNCLLPKLQKSGSTTESIIRRCCIHMKVCAHVLVCVRVCVCVWMAAGKQTRPSRILHLATDLVGRWQFQSNSHPASQWTWPPNISITLSSTALTQPVTQERGQIHVRRWTHVVVFNEKSVRTLKY